MREPADLARRTRQLTQEMTLRRVRARLALRGLSFAIRRADVGEWRWTSGLPGHPPMESDSFTTLGAVIEAADEWSLLRFPTPDEA